MKKLFTAAVLAGAVAGSATLSYADEMPIKGVCVNGSETVTFEGARMPIIDPATGDKGVTQVTMDKEQFELLFGSKIALFLAEPDKDGFSDAAVGELSLRIKQDDKTVTLRASSSNFEAIMKTYIAPVRAGGQPLNWKCDIKPNLP